MAEWEETLRRHPNGQPRLMGVVNATPDSFHRASRQQTTEDAYDAAQSHIKNGADWIDVGGESTRPDAAYVSPEVEAKRVIPVIQKLSSQHPISIDTRNVATATKALDAGALMVNDVSGLRDPAMMDLIIERGAAVCIMHMRGDPSTMQHNTKYENVVEEVASKLLGTADEMRDIGHPHQRILLDPGIGFGKGDSENLALLSAVDELRGECDYGVLWGTSRKSFIGRLCSRPDTDDRLPGTLATAATAMELGVDVLRVHDIAAHSDFFLIKRHLQMARRGYA